MQHVHARNQGNVGHLIPAGTGIYRCENVELSVDVEAAEEGEV